MKKCSVKEKKMYIQEKDLKLNKGYYIQRKYLPYEVSDYFPYNFWLRKILRFFVAEI